MRKPGQKGGVKNEEGITLTFFVPYQVPAGEDRIPAGTRYSLEVISDRWYDLSFIADIDLENMAIPDEDYPNTKLLPLRPMPITALQDEAFENLYKNKLTFFNPV